MALMVIDMRSSVPQTMQKGRSKFLMLFVLQTNEIGGDIILRAVIKLSVGYPIPLV